MATRAEIIANFKKEYPTLKVGSDEIGYTDLSKEDYEATINQWADNAIAEAELGEQQSAKEAAKAAAQAKLAALGLTTDDLKALGL
jgi:hypothetical protein